MLVDIDCPGYDYGDVDMDGTAGVKDAVGILRHVVGLKALTPDQEAIADVSGNGETGVYDAGLLLRNL